MTDFMGMMQKAQELQEKVANLKQELATMTVEGSAGAGLVRLTASARGEIREIAIDPSLLKPDEADIVQDLIVAAHADAIRKGEALMEDKMRQMTDGLPLPPGMKLPF
jgi:DNA-binding YbaB/EbfC family protein